MARTINDRMALDLIAARGPLSRSELKAATGLSHPTVAEVVGRLERAGLIAPAGLGGTRKRGPNAQLYDIDARHGIVAGVSVNAHEAHAVIADLRGATLGEATVPAGEAEPGALVLGAVEEAAGAAGTAVDDLRTSVVGIHGLVGPDGDLGFAWDLPHWQHRVIGPLRRAMPCPVRLETDVNLAAVAEHHGGGAQERDTFGSLWIGTGIGFSLILEGRVMRGVSGGAGQIGYMPAPGAPVIALPSAHDSRHGYPGGLQALIGAEAVQQLAAVHGQARDTAVATVTAAARSGSSLLTAYAERVATGLAAICTVVDPGFVVLTGDIGHAGGRPLAQAVQQFLTAVCPVPADVAAGTLSGDTVTAGAVTSAVADARDRLWGVGRRA